MKIFTQESFVKEVAESMEKNLVKNAYAEQQVETSHRFHALERLAEAADLFEKAGNIEKASQLTDLIVRLSNDGKERETLITSKISSLENTINVMQRLYNSNISDVDKYMLTSTANKITALISALVDTTSDINESVANLKNAHANTPKTLNVVNEAIKVADGTMAIVLDKKEEDPKSKKNIVEVLKHFGFKPEDLSGLKADDGNEDSDEYWEK